MQHGLFSMSYMRHHGFIHRYYADSKSSKLKKNRFGVKTWLRISVLKPSKHSFQYDLRKPISIKGFDTIYTSLNLYIACFHFLRKQLDVSSVKDYKYKKNYTYIVTKTLPDTTKTSSTDFLLCSSVILILRLYHSHLFMFLTQRYFECVYLQVLEGRSSIVRFVDYRF